jgi:Rps23 Pro-64 3,4-dihydroxylase Tpa1-like proline 4-hydroxylase
MKENIVKLIVEKLIASKKELKQSFKDSKNIVGTRFCYIDDLLPLEVVKEIYDLFPSNVDMRLMSSFREEKYTSKDFNKHNKLLKDITFAIQDPEVIAQIEDITGIKGQIPDESLYAGGLSSMAVGNFLNPHIDNSHEMNRRFYRTLNLLYYVTPNWLEEYGGNLELWDLNVKSNTTIWSKYNRLVLMETTPTSWHSVNEVTVDNSRNCVSNYYFSKISPTGKEYFNVTTFSARPEQKYRRIVAAVDSTLRNVVRKIIPKGLGKKDIYKGKTLD